MLDPSYAHQKLGEAIRELLLTEDPERIAAAFPTIRMASHPDPKALLNAAFMNEEARRYWSRLLALIATGRDDLTTAQQLSLQQRFELSNCLYWVHYYVADAHYAWMRR